MFKFIKIKFLSFTTRTIFSRWNFAIFLKCKSKEIYTFFLKHTVTLLLTYRLNIYFTVIYMQMQRLYGKYLRAESFRKALVYQKKYLLLLLGGFQECEQATLCLIARMGVYPSPTDFHVPNRHSRPLTKFRSTIRVVIAISRYEFSSSHLMLKLFKLWENAYALKCSRYDFFPVKMPAWCYLAPPLNKLFTLFELNLIKEGVVLF